MSPISQASRHLSRQPSPPIGSNHLLDPELALCPSRLHDLIGIRMASVKAQFFSGNKYQLIDLVPGSKRKVLRQELLQERPQLVATLIPTSLVLLPRCLHHIALSSVVKPCAHARFRDLDFAAFLCNSIRRYADVVFGMNLVSRISWRVSSSNK